MSLVKMLNPAWWYLQLAKVGLKAVFWLAVFAVVAFLAFEIGLLDGVLPAGRPLFG